MDCGDGPTRPTWGVTALAGSVERIDSLCYRRRGQLQRLVIPPKHQRYVGWDSPKRHHELDADRLSRRYWSTRTSRCDGFAGCYRSNR
jgi:hypothetical protein